MRSPLWRRSSAHMIGGFLLMGAWGVFANAAHPPPTPWIAGLVQGVLSALITLGLKRTLEHLINRWPGIAGLLVPPLVACAFSLSLLASVHTLAGTPEVLRTLAVPTSVATFYAALYTWQLWRTRHS